MTVVEPRGVLLAAFRFPPHGGGGVHRTAHFARRLPEFGWRPHVLTGPKDGRRHVLDPSLERLVEDVPVTRTGYTDVDRLYRALGTVRLAGVARALTPWLPNLQPGWIPHAVRAGRRLIEREPIDVLFSSAYPLSSHVVAGVLKRESGLPWVADYRDEWSLRRRKSWPTPLHRRLARWIDGRITAEADRVVTTSPAHARRFAEAFDAPASRYVTVTNGFDAADFGEGDGGGAAGSAGGSEDVFTVAHVGTLFTWRSAGPFLRAVRGVLRDGVVDEDRLRVRLVGYGPEVGFDDLQRRGVLQVTGYVSHDRAVAEMSSADLLLLLNTERTNIPAKTFEYLASGRPVLAAVRPGPTADLVRRKRAGRIVDPSDAGAIREALERSLSVWREGRPETGARREDVAEFTRRELTRRLAAVLQEEITRAAEPVRAQTAPPDRTKP